VKPLFYSLRPDALVFGSEMKAVLCHPSVRHEITAEGLAEIFAIGPARTPGFGIFRDIAELRPGTCLLYDEAHAARIRTY
jgi:asparagine synthase (glutamine-hydrolysing)